MTVTCLGTTHQKLRIDQGGGHLCRDEHLRAANIRPCCHMTTDLTAQLHQYLTSAPGSLFAHQEIKFLAHWEGDANLLWRVRAAGQEAVVKLFLDAGQARSRRQFDGHTLFAPLGLAPQPLWADRYPHGMSRQLIVYRWIDGETIDTTDPGALQAWAQTIATLHSAPTDAVRRFSPHPINLDFYWRIEQGSIAQIKKWLEPSGLAITTQFNVVAAATAELVHASLPLWAAARPVAVHGDLARAHTLVERSRIMLVDWEMFGLGDPALDAARLLQRESQTLQPHQFAQWLDAYFQVADQPGLEKRIEIFRRLLDVHNVIYLLTGLQQNIAGQHAAELVEAMPFLQAALSAALEGASAAVALPELTDSTAMVADLIRWLLDAIPAQS